MKKITHQFYRLLLCCITACCLFNFNLQAQDSLTLSTLKSVPDGSEIIEGMLQTSDSKLLLVGSTNAFSSGGDEDALLIKMSKSGDVDWAKTYGGSADDMILDVKETNNSDYIIVGWTKSFGALSYDFWVFKTDSSGNILWEKRYGGSSNEQAWSVDIDNDDYLVVGGTTSFGAGQSDLWALKLDLNGNILWQKTYGSDGDDAPAGPYDEYVARGIVDQSGSYVISSMSDSLGNGDFDIWMARLNSTDGSVITQYAYGDIDEETTWSFTESSNGGYLLSGQMTDPITFESDLWALLVDTNGNIIWQKTFGISGKWDEALFAISMQVGGFLLGGYYEESVSDWIATMLKVGNNGNLIWANEYKTGHLDWTNTVYPLTDNTIALVGVTTDTTTWNEDIMFIRADSNGTVPNCNYISSFTPNVTSTSTIKKGINLSVANTTVVSQSTSSNINTATFTKNNLCNQPLSVSEFYSRQENNYLIYPNPSSKGLFTIEQTVIKNTPYEIIDITGKVIKKGTLKEKRTTIDLSKNASGVYLLKIDGQTVNMIKQ